MRRAADDWRAIGLADGAAGAPAALIARRAEAGAMDAADRAAWTAGWREGNARFCTVDGAYRAGIDGVGLGACGAVSEEMRAAEARGARFGEITREIIALERLARDIRDGRAGQAGFATRRPAAAGGVSGARRALIAIDDADRLAALNDVRDRIRALTAERAAHAR